MSLPKGWTGTVLGEIANFIMGQAPPGSACNHTGDGTPFVKAGEFGLRRPIIREWTTQPLKFATAEDVLICVVGATAGKLNLGADCAIGRSVAAIRPSPATKTEFLFARLQSEVSKLRGASTGTAQGVISKEMLANIPVDLPPSAEQRRIVAKLDALTARISRARAELERVPRLGRRFREEALTKCFEQSEPNLELASRLHAIESGKNLRCEERPPRDGEKGVVKVSAVTWGRFDETQSKTLPPVFVPSEKSRIKSGDLLISRANTLELVGAAVLVEHQPRDLYLSDKILRLVVTDEDKKWILWFLRSPIGRGQIESGATGNQLSMRNISQDALRRIRMPFPDLPVRAGRIRTLEAAFARADRLEAEAARARKLLDRLESTILAKAFRGELVPQDPKDEPADKLLERICAERAAAPTKKKGRKKTA